MSIKGYKVFNPDWSCRGFQYEVGKTFKHDGSIKMCREGFHFCRNILDCFSYYDFDSDNKVAEVEAIGNVETRGNKSVTDEIAIVRELTWYEVLDLVNTGKNCTGRRNSGSWNSGNWNSGDCNSGSYNSGSRNSDSWNIGNWNSGSWNSGNFNSGDYNSGNWNSGSWNSGNFSAGYFNSEAQPIYIFNKPANISRDDFELLLAVRAMRRNYKNNRWISSENMTEDEKSAHPEHETTGGYLKTVDFKTACSIMWDNMTDEEKSAVEDIPNFDAKIFEEITGIVV